MERRLPQHHLVFLMYLLYLFEMEREKQIFGVLAHFPSARKVRVGPGWKQVSEAQFWSNTWWWDPSIWASLPSIQSHLRTLDSGAEPGLEPSNSNMGSGHPEACCQHNLLSGLSPFLGYFADSYMVHNLPWIPLPQQSFSWVLISGGVGTFKECIL